MMAWPRIASFILLMLFMMIGGCTAPTDSTPVSVPLDTPPDYKQIVRAAIQQDKANQKKPDQKKLDKKAATNTKGDDAKPAGKTEKGPAGTAGQRNPSPVARITQISSRFGWSGISKPRAVNALAGWAWQVCPKGKNKNSVVYLAVFMQYNSIVDARTGTEPDKCESETYEPL